MDKSKIICTLLETSSSSASSSESSTSDDNWSEWSSVASIDYSTFNPDEDILLFPLFKYLTTGNKRQRIENFVAVVESWSNSEFREHLRISRSLALHLIDDFENSAFIPRNHFGREPICGKISFYVFLWFISNTEPLRILSQLFDISISSVFRVLRRVIAWILTKMDDTIKWPNNNNEIQKVTDGFFAQKQIPKVLGAIDGTHIRIEKPSENTYDFYNRKKYFSINLQAVVDSTCKFTNVYCGEPGSVHDARVFRRSPLYETADQHKDVLFPDNTFLLGDSAYPSLPWLVPAFRVPVTQQQIQFNMMHSSTRMFVERAFGMLKGRFRRIKFFSEYKDLSFLTKTVIAACILHNFCIDEGDEIFEDNDDDNDGPDENNDLVPQGNIQNQNCRDRRRMLMAELFPPNRRNVP